MAMHVQKTVVWQAGEGSPVKYAFSLDGYLEVESMIGNTAVINLSGTVSVENHPYNSRNSYAASDFAVLTPGTVNVATHPFVSGTSYYQHYIPFLPDPQNSDQDNIIVQFRGDTWRNDPNNSNNKVSLYTKTGGLVVNQNPNEMSQQFSINFSYEVPISSGHNTPILAWISSGAGSSTDYGWMDRQVWATWIDLNWTARIHLDMNGGSGGPSDATAIDYTDTQTLTVPDGAPTWGDYIFLGWSRTQYSRSCTPEDVEYVAGDTITIQKSSPTITLYAVWMKDYRPGAVLTSGEWKSTNRTDGKCHVKQNGSWVEMRTIDGGSGEGNPPSRRTGGVWKNQYKIGSY